MNFNFTSFLRMAAIALSTGCVSATASAASPMLPGLWELRVATTIEKRELPSMTSRECLTQSDIDHETKTLPRPDGDCTLSNIVTAGDKTTYDTACKLDNLTVRGRMELYRRAESYDGLSDMKFGGVRTKDIPATIVVNAKRIGDCPK